MGKRGPKPRDPAARFAEKIRHDDATGCWLWQSQISNVGYGLFYAAPGKVVSAHSWAFRRWNDVIPAGLELDHLCRNRACCNPWHLETVTRSENVLRGLSGRLRPGSDERTREYNRAKTARYRARKKAAV
jgi:HNH endonuclease